MRAEQLGSDGGRRDGRPPEAPTASGRWARRGTMRIGRHVSKYPPPPARHPAAPDPTRGGGFRGALALRREFIRLGGPRPDIPLQPGGRLHR